MRAFNVLLYSTLIPCEKRKLEDQDIDDDVDNDVAVIDDIIRALLPMRDDVLTGMLSRFSIRSYCRLICDVAHDNAVKRSIPFSRFEDECPQPEMQLIRHRASNRGDDRPCFVTLHLSTNSFLRILRVDWSATTTPTTFPSPSGAFRSLNNVHLKFPFATSQDRDHNSQEDLTITISAGEISFSTGTCSISPGKGSTLSSKHCTVNINNYITKIMGDAFFGTINGGNNGGRNNTNTSAYQYLILTFSTWLTLLASWHIEPCWLSFASCGVPYPSQTDSTSSTPNRVTGRCWSLGTAPPTTSQAVLKLFRSSCPPSGSPEQTGIRLRRY